MTAMDIQEISTELISNKIKVVLTSIGLNEKYKGFNYLTHIITYMIKHESDSSVDYNIAIELIAVGYNITKSAINDSLKKITSQCMIESINCKMQFNLTNKGMLNKIRLIKGYTLQAI